MTMELPKRYAVDLEKTPEYKLAALRSWGWELVHVPQRATGLPVTTFNHPAFTCNGWRFFMEYEQFIPSAENSAYICHCFAWKDTNSRYYCAIPGIDGAFEYGKGKELPIDPAKCRISAATDQVTINAEYVAAMATLHNLVVEREGLPCHLTK